MLKGLPLGSTDSFDYEVKEVKIERGDTIFLMSDGFPELLNKNGEMYGYDKVQNIFAEVADQSNDEIIEHLKKAASDWVEDEDPNDDVTFLLMKVK